MRSKRTILLYCPPPTLERPSSRAPLALLAISSLLANRGYDIHILPRHPDSHQPYFAKYADDVVCYGVSVMTGPQIVQGLASSRMCKEMLPDVPVVWGGWHPTIFPEQVAQHPVIDIAVRGQAERTFAQLVRQLGRGSSYERVSGLTFERDGELHRTAAPSFENINRFPPSPYSLLRMGEYIFAGELGTATINYVSSRGCPYHCAYCAQNMVSGGKWYGLSAERAASDMKLLKDGFGINGILFDDANFFVDRRRVERLAHRLTQNRVSVGWGMVTGRIEDLKHYPTDLWARLKASGLLSVFVGLEPLCGASAKPAGSIFRELERDVVKLAGATGQLGIKLKISVLVGFPPDVHDWSFEKELIASQDLLKSCSDVSKTVEGTITSYLPFPHAPLFGLSVKAGLKPPQNLEDWGTWVPEKQEMPWLPKDSLKMIEEMNQAFRQEETV